MIKILQLVFVSVTIVFTSYGTTIYVTALGAGSMNGTSWNNAAPGTELQYRITLAQSGDEVWVACGEFYPTSIGDRTISFALRTGIAIYGGFSGSETSLSQRNLNCGSCSILSGEIGSVSESDNSYKVVRNELVDSTAVLDGFVIEGANDDRQPTSFGDGLGGGIYNHGFGNGGNASPTIRNCIIQNNKASWGAGAFNNGYNTGSSKPTYVNCVFYYNHSYIEAGGMDSYGVGGTASPTLYNCLFYENSAATNVGAMYAWGGNVGGNCHPKLYNCAFINNHAENGYCGAFVADNLDENGTSSSGSCTVTLHNCLVWNNEATGLNSQFHKRGAGSQVLMSYSLVQLTNQTATIDGPGTGNVFANPSFVDLNNPLGLDNCWFSADDGLYLTNNSPALDQGQNVLFPTTDITGAARMQGTKTDMGPYERANSSGINELLNKEFIISPNPGSERLVISAANIDSNEPRIFSMWGQEMVCPILQCNDEEIVFDTENLAIGTYFIKIQGNIQKWSKCY